MPAVPSFPAHDPLRERKRERPAVAGLARHALHAFGSAKSRLARVAVGTSLATGGVGLARVAVPAVTVESLQPCPPAVAPGKAGWASATGPGETADLGVTRPGFAAATVAARQPARAVEALDAVDTGVRDDAHTLQREPGAADRADPVGGRARSGAGATDGVDQLEHHRVTGHQHGLR